jgi:hypothetical protein
MHKVESIARSMEELKASTRVHRTSSNKAIVELQQAMAALHTADTSTQGNSDNRAFTDQGNIVVESQGTMESTSTFSSTVLNTDDAVTVCRHGTNEYLCISDGVLDGHADAHFEWRAMMEQEAQTNPDSIFLIRELVNDSCHLELASDAQFLALVKSPSVLKRGFVATLASDMTNDTQFTIIPETPGDYSAVRLVHSNRYHLTAVDSGGQSILAARAIIKDSHGLFSIKVIYL